MNDWICLKLARRNHGIYEPEFRLVLMIVVVLVGTVGFYGFGATVHYETHWAGPVLTFGFANMALAFASTCVFGYVLVSSKCYLCRLDIADGAQDCYPRLAEEAFVAINTRNLLTFGLVRLVALRADERPLTSARLTSSTPGSKKTVLSLSSMFLAHVFLLSVP